jgi:hypothetical protein
MSHHRTRPKFSAQFARKAQKTKTQVSGRTAGSVDQRGIGGIGSTRRAPVGVGVVRAIGVTGVGATGARGRTVTGRTGGFVGCELTLFGVFIGAFSSLKEFRALGRRHVAQSGSQIRGLLLFHCGSLFFQHG